MSAGMPSKCAACAVALHTQSSESGTNRPERVVTKPQRLFRRKRFLSRWVANSPILGRYRRRHSALFRRR